MPMIGSTIGHYVIRASLGSGAMGDVFEAEDTRLARRVAIKFLTADMTGDSDRALRFASEARVVSALNHPNILTIHETGESARGPFIVTELVDGVTLRALLSDGPLPLARALDIATQVASGLARAHDAGIVHRDIKPENVMVTHDGLAKILDFGLAKPISGRDASGEARPQLTMTGAIVGTPAYLAPEQLQGQPADARSDVYALGVLLYEMLTGVNPLHRDVLGATLNAILSEGVPPLGRTLPSAPPTVQDIVRRATHRSPSKRFDHAKDMMHVLRDEQVRASSGGSAAGVAAPPRRIHVWVLGAAVVALAIVASLLVRDRLSPGPGSRAGVVTAEFGPRPGTTGVAILPIRNETRDVGLADSDVGRILADAFVQILIDVPGLYVISPERLDALARTHDRSLEHASEDPALARRIGMEASADAVLSGRLSKLGDTYVLSATLTDIPTNHVLETFQARATGPESLLEELSGAVGGEFRRKYAPAEPEVDVGEVATRSLDAYAHYLRGEDLLAEGDWLGAVPELSRAIEIDPEMALAWSSLSCAFSFAGDDTRARAAQLKASEYLDRLNEMERRWIALDALWVETGSGDVYMEEIEKYIHDFPDDRDAYFYAGLAMHWLRNDPSGAVPWLEKAFVMIPNYWPVTKALVDAHEALHDRSGSLAALRRYLSQPTLRERGRHSAEQKLAELGGATRG